MIAHLIAIERALRGAGPRSMPRTPMIVKFLAHGTGSARKGGRLPPRSAGRHREDRAKDVEVLRGDPNQVAAVADTLAFEHRYTSGVIAWAPEDRADRRADRSRPRRVRERPRGPGSKPTATRGRRCSTARRSGGAHVHVLAARCDLETGRSLNIAPPGWEKTFGPLRDAFNHQHGWSRPDDPARARVQQPGTPRLRRGGAPAGGPPA